MYLSLSGSEVNQYYHIIFRCRVTGPLGQTRTVNPATNEPEDPQDFPKPSCISETDSLRKCGVSIWGKMCRTWESHGKIIGRRWAKDGTTWLQLLSFFFWLEESEKLDPILLSLVCKDNYRESTALTKKLMALKGKGESKTVTWRNVVSPVDADWTFQMQSGI